MKKTKFEQRKDSLSDPFFTYENFDRELLATNFQNCEEIQAPTATNLHQKADKYFGLFKKIFCFLPGVLLLHMVVPALLMFDFHIGGLFWIVAGTFMVWAGIGDLKNIKHLFLPLSVMLVALIFSLPFAVFPRSLQDYYIYFYALILPLLFITPILLKGYLKEN